MRRLAAVVVLVCAAAGVAGAEIRSYSLVLRVDSAGDGAGTLTLTLAGGAPAVRVPVGVANITDVVITNAPAGSTVIASRAGKQSALLVTMPAATTGPVTLAIEFRAPALMPAPVVAEGERPTLPEGVRLFKHTFVNTESAPVGRYDVEVLFPRELRAHAVSEALPKLRATEAGPRVQLGGRDGAQTARLDVAALAQGDSASMQIELTPARRSWTWLIVGVLLSLAYLFSFRDLVSSRAARPGPNA
ncbi:MAG TPA: hypothetical protein PKW63_12855 [Vicinamibacterales bacterium]|jgi:hypothetical protein|nr:hypothetical protein [Vicinamibacterales bacterium]